MDYEYFLLFLAANSCFCACTVQTDVPALKDVFAKDFYIGCLTSYNKIGFSTDPQIGQSAVITPEGGYLIKYDMISWGRGII